MKAISEQLMRLLAAAIILFIPNIGIAEEWNLEEKPWEKFGANFGVFLSTVDSSFRIGSGIGLDIDVEELLGLDSTNTVFRADALWRFSQNRRHRLDLSWFAFRRDGNRQILDDITIEDDNGDKITIEAGTTVEAFFDLDILQLAYSYSFIQDERLDLAVAGGLYIMPMDFGINASGLIEEQGSEKFTAPLPVLGVRMDVALTPQWFIRSGAQVFYLKYENFTGSVLEFRAAVEYNPWKHVGLGLGFDSLNVSVDADGSTDWPGVDLNGKIEFAYTGLQLYLRIFY